MFDLNSHLAETMRSGAPWFVRGWQPKTNCVFVLPLIETDRSRGGIIAPDEARERPQKGVVLAVGSGLWDDEQRRLIPVDVGVGDLVLYGKYAGSLFAIEHDLDVFVMVNPELKARKLYLSYTLVTHVVGAGTPQERKVYHELDTFCAHCPPEPVDESLAEERRRFQAEKAAELSEEVSAAVLDAALGVIAASRVSVGSIPQGGIAASRVEAVRNVLSTNALGGVLSDPAAEPVRMTLAQGDGDQGDTGDVNDREGCCDKGCGDVGLKMCVCENCGEGVYR